MPWRSRSTFARIHGRKSLMSTMDCRKSSKFRKAHHATSGVEGLLRETVLGVQIHLVTFCAHRTEKMALKFSTIAYDSPCSRRHRQLSPAGPEPGSIQPPDERANRNDAVTLLDLRPIQPSRQSPALPGGLQIPQGRITGLPVLPALEQPGADSPRHSRAQNRKNVEVFPLYGSVPFIQTRSPLQHPTRVLLNCIRFSIATCSPFAAPHRVVQPMSQGHGILKTARNQVTKAKAAGLSSRKNRARMAVPYGKPGTCCHASHVCSTALSASLSANRAPSSFAREWWTPWRRETTDHFPRRGHGENAPNCPLSDCPA